MKFFRFLLVIWISLIAGAWTHGEAVYTGLIATRARVDVGLIASPFTAQMSRTGHIARTNISSVQFLEGCFYVNESTHQESATGANCVVTESVEYPSGTCTPLKFSGASSITITDGNSLLTDALTISIPNGATFWRRQYLTNTAGIINQGNIGGASQFLDATTMGDALNSLGPTDKTVSCASITNDNQFGNHAPLAIIGPTTKPSVCIFGDSIGEGLFDVYSPSNQPGDLGLIERSIGPNFAYANVSVGADSAVNFVASHTNRAKIFQYCTTAIGEYGANEISSGASTLWGNLQTIYGYFGLQIRAIYETTITPRTTASGSCTYPTGTGDCWATTGAQTTTAEEGQRALFNSNLRNGTYAPTGGYFDMSAAVGNGTNTSLWNVTGINFGYTADGLHPVPAGYQLPINAGTIPTSSIK